MYIHTYIHIYIYIYTHVLRETHDAAPRRTSPPKGVSFVHVSRETLTIILYSYPKLMVYRSYSISIVLVVILLIYYSYIISIFVTPCHTSPPKGVHPVSITRFPLRRFSPGAGLLRNRCLS